MIMVLFDHVDDPILVFGYLIVIVFVVSNTHGKAEKFGWLVKC